MNEGRALVIGAGVSGLTSALCLQRQGWQVTLVAEKFAPHVTSAVAGALWEYPPAICTRHQDEALLQRSKKWSLASYSTFEKLARKPNSGVFLRPATFCFRRPIAEAPEHFKKMNELKDKVREFIHDSAQAVAGGVDPSFSIRDAYSYIAPMIDTDAYLEWMRGELRQHGCHFETRRITGSLRDQKSALRQQYQADVVVNCAGLGAGELAVDNLYPMRGALIRARNDGKSIPRINRAYCVPQGELADENGFVFIVPRGQDMLLLGGLAEPGESDLSIGLRNYEPIQAILQRCIAFMPALKNIEIDDAEPVRVGLRPMRAKDVRVEREPETCIIHNYGHGGSGVTLSWGCALEVVEIARGM